MKIYGYSIDVSMYRTNKYIFKEIVAEVEESNDRYMADKKKRIPFTYMSHIFKSNIGRLIGFSKNVIYLLEPDVEYAKTKLLENYSQVIMDAEQEYKKALRALE